MNKQATGCLLASVIFITCLVFAFDFLSVDKHIFHRLKNQLYISYYYYYNDTISHATSHVCPPNTNIDRIFNSFDLDQYPKQNNKLVQQLFNFDDFENLHSNNSAIALQKLRQAIFARVDLKNEMIPNCLNNLPLFVNYGSHHKTGSRFSRLIFESVFKYCGILNKRKLTQFHLIAQAKNFSSMATQNIKRITNDNFFFVSFFGKYPHWPLLLANNEYFVKNFKQNMILLNFIRSPLNVIISAFNYHKQCWQEAWLRCKIAQKDCIYYTVGINLRRWRLGENINYNITTGDNIDNNDTTTTRSAGACADDHQLDSTYRRLTDIDSDYIDFPLLNANERYMSNHEYSNVFECYTKGNLIRKEVIDDLFVKQNQTICHLNSNENISIQERLYYEFVRFLNCEFEELFVSYLIIKNYKYGYNFRMEDYTESSQKFDHFADFLMTRVLNLKFDSKNSDEYLRMMNLMRSNDVHRWSNQDLAKNGHVVSKNSKGQKAKLTTDQQKRILMSQIYKKDDNTLFNVCKSIKDMTQKLDYQWNDQLESYCT